MIQEFVQISHNHVYSLVPQIFNVLVIKHSSIRSNTVVHVLTNKHTCAPSDLNETDNLPAVGILQAGLP